jgi:uncharacterized membrane protein (TIGR01666 family)
MRHQTSAIPYFFFSQALADGLRITFSILAPVLFFRHIGQFETGLAISFGAVCVNITDNPGPMHHKRNGLLIASLFVFAASLLSGLFHIHLFLTGFLICVFTFIFSMFAIYGVRAATVGSAALLVLILCLGDPPASFSELLIKSLLILAGALWYSAISLLLSTIRPYRMAQRALGECIRETARFLYLKSNFYNPAKDLNTCYHDLLSQQVIVNEKQNYMRELLYKTRQIVKDTNGTGRLLMLTFVETIDLFEQITASYYNYEAIRKVYADRTTLKKIEKLIKHMSFELNAIGFAIHSNTAYKKGPLPYHKLEALRAEMDRCLPENSESREVMHKVADNIESIYHLIYELSNYFDEESLSRRNRKIEHGTLIEHQDFSFNVLWDNLTFQSSAFRHALRVTIACLCGFIVAQLLDYGHHSYWILLTIVFIIKPAFGLTKKRNLERLVGTAAGGIIGMMIISFFPQEKTLFIFLLFLMIGTYTFMRINYVTTVIFTTPYILITFTLLGSGYMTVIQERLIDTGIGCGIALLAIYLLFPKWEAEQLEDHIHHVIKANLNYLRNYAFSFSGKSPDPVEQKVARKEVFVSSANLSAAFQRMLSEPRKKQRNSDKVYEFVVLNHILTSNIAGLSANRSGKDNFCSEEELSLLNKIQLVLFDCLKSAPGQSPADDIFEQAELKKDQRSTLKEQLEFILRLCRDIYKARKIIQN